MAVANQSERKNDLERVAFGRLAKDVGTLLRTTNGGSTAKAIKTQYIAAHAEWHKSTWKDAPDSNMMANV
jgi:hypothetical protein